MKRNLLLTSLFVFAFAGLFAQGTDGSGMVLRVTIDGVDSDFTEGACGFSTTTWGGEVTTEICGSAVWGYSAPGDSLGCTDVTAGTLTGKIGMIRRGNCEFGVKALSAEHGGASAVMVVNGVLATHGDDCNAPGMAAGVSGGMVTVPVILICRAVANQIDNAIKAGKTVNVCFLLPRSSSPFAGFSYAIPASQASELTTLCYNFNNRETADITDLVIKAEILEPGGNVATFTASVPTLAPGADTLLCFEGYTPPSVEGEFNVTFTNNKYSESRDTLRRKFVHTQYTYASDNLELMLDGGAQLNANFATDQLYQISTLLAAGPNGSKGTHCTFGLSKIDSVYVPGNSIANTLTIFLYKADSDGNGALDLDTDFSDLEIVGIGTYEFKGTEEEAVLVDAEIYDLLTNELGATMEADNLYYVSIQYDGTANGSGQNCAFSNSAQVPYLFFTNEAGTGVPSAAIKLGGSISYWGDRTCVCRLQTEGYVPPTIAVKPNILDATKYAVSPNPANDNVVLDLNLATQSSSVVVSIVNPMGQKLSSQVVNNFKNGQINLDVKSVPSGVYMMTIRTEEGIGVKKVMICH